MPLSSEHQQFIDDFADHWARVGANVSQGRALALLFVIPGGEATATDFVELLGLSRGAVSQITRELVRMQLVQRVSRPGDRRDWFRIAPNPLGEAARAERQQIPPFLALFRRALDLHPAGASPTTRALTNSIAFLQDYDAALSAFFETWQPPDPPEAP